MNLLKSYLLENYSLGDLAATLYALENIGRQKNENIYLQIEGLNSHLYDCFDFKHIRLGSSKNSLNETLKLNHFDFCKENHCGFFHKKYNFISVLMNHFVNFHEYKPSESKPLILKEILKFDKSEKVYAQFDGRTGARQNRDMRQFQKINVLNKVSNWSCLGGKDTNKYLGEDNIIYELGDINFIVSKLFSSRGFIGCDSGISHLAGCLGVESKIYILGDCFYCLSDYYTSSYRNCKVVRPVIKLI